MKTLIELTSSLPFTSDFDFFFEKDTLVFTIFIVNPVISDDEKLKNLTLIYQNLKKFLHPWSRFYTWGYKPYQMELALYEENNEKYNYIFGSLQFSDCINDEWLLVSLILKYFQEKFEKVEINLEDVMIHFFDQDGEFILVESFDHIPDWCSPDNSFNRVWFNGKGDLVLIPDKYPILYNIENLKLQQALLFLIKYNYYIDKVSLHDAGIYIWKSKLNQAIEESLRMSSTITVQVNESLCFWLINLNILNDHENDCNNGPFGNVIARSFESFINENNGIFEQSNELLNNLKRKFETKNQKFLNELIFKNTENDRLIRIHIRLHLLWFYICKTKFDQKNTSPDTDDCDQKELLEQYLGKVLRFGLRNIMESDVELENQFLKIIEKFFDGGLHKLMKLSDDPNYFDFINVLKEQIHKYDIEQQTINEKFQNNLINKYHLINEIIPSQNFEEFAENARQELYDKFQGNKTNNLYEDAQKKEENEMIERIKKFIDEENFKFGKAGNNEKNELQIDITQEIDEFYKNDSDYDSENDRSDNKILSYMKKGKNVVEPDSINEDDFFEFFLTDALKIPKEELEKYKATSSTNAQPQDSIRPTAKTQQEVEEILGSHLANRIINGDYRDDVDDDNEDYIDYVDYVDDDIPEEEMNKIIVRMKEILTQMGFKPNSFPRDAFIESLHEDNRNHLDKQP